MLCALNVYVVSRLPSIYLTRYAEARRCGSDDASFVCKSRSYYKSRMSMFCFEMWMIVFPVMHQTYFLNEGAASVAA